MEPNLSTPVPIPLSIPPLIESATLSEPKAPRPPANATDNAFKSLISSIGVSSAAICPKLFNPAAEKALIIGPIVPGNISVPAAAAYGAKNLSSFGINLSLTFPAAFTKGFSTLLVAFLRFLFKFDKSPIVSF